MLLKLVSWITSNRALFYVTMVAIILLANSLSLAREVGSG